MLESHILIYLFLYSKPLLHQDSPLFLLHLLQQVNDLEITPNGEMVAACGYQHIRMYDLASANPDPVMNFDSISKNVSRVGFQVS